MIAFQKDIFSPTVEGTKEIIMEAESSDKTKALTEKFRQEHDDKHKRILSAVCYQAIFEESVNDKGVEACWRKQETAHLTGEVVSDFDHLEDNPRTLFVQWQAMLDFKKEGILKIFITPSGEGIKVVSKWRKEWGNLAENQLQIARMLGMETYLDASGKDSSRAAFVPMRSDVLYEDDEVYTYFDPECDEIYGDAYRRGESGITKEKAETAQQKAQDKSEAKPAIVFTEREQAIIKALNEYYGESLGEGKKHPTFCQQTAHWLCWLVDNNPQKAIAMAYELDYVKNWQPQPNEVEDLVNSAASKKLLKCTPKELRELLQKAGIDADLSRKATDIHSDDDLPFAEWIEKIRGLFDVYPCVREICEPHPEKLWPFLLFAAAAFIGTDMTLCYWYFYDQPEKKRRLNYNVLGVGDPAVGKAPLERIENLLTEAMDLADKVVNDATNEWKEEQRGKGANKDKAKRPKGIVRKHGARTSNNIFISDMVNAYTEIDGERVQMHMLTVDTEALNSIKMQRGGSWIDKNVMEIKSWSNERDSQQYGNLDSVTGPFNVYWNQVRTCTPPALKVLVNESNFGTGYPLRLYVLPVPDKGFDMIPLRRRSQKALDSDEVIRQWGYRMDKRQGELPIWPLVEHAWHWTNDRMEIAAFNEDKADRMLLKRCSVNGICIAAPWVDMRHWDEREKTGTYEPDDTDKALLDLVLDIQYKTQRHYFYELARKYFEEQMNDATQYRRRTTRFQQCYLQLSEVFTTEQFVKVFGYANQHSAAKTLNRLIKDKVIERTKRGEYRKLVSSIN